MLFNSFEFLFFFPIVLLVYYIIPKKIKYLWLLAASYYFYMCWNARYALLILASTIVTYISGVLIEKAHSSIRLKKWIVAGSFLINLGILFYYKYFNFILDSVSRLAGKFHVQLNMPVIDVLLPVGISFYTFQALSYTVDIYRGEIKAEKNFFRYALFVSFFPQLVAGPIERSKNLLTQIQNIPVNCKFNWERVSHGLTVMLWGLFTKMVIADRIAIFVDSVFNNYTQYGTVELSLAAMGFAVQIYCDFSGYSSIAIGSASILGFDLMENFEAPYFSASIKEFWRRWHISLSTWFRDYIYIPLGGNRKGKIRKWINLLVTMGVSGLWHGANWSYVAWGLLHGVYQIGEDILKKPMQKINQKLGTRTDVFSYKLLQRIVTFFFVTIAWVFFRSNGVKDSIYYLKLMFTKGNTWVLFDQSLYNLGLDRIEVQILMLALLVLAVVDYLQYRYKMRIDMALAGQNVWFRYLILFALFTAIWVFGMYGPTFDSQQFIYFQF